MLNKPYNGLKWCELGNQRDYDNKVAKEKYSALGVDHISIDMNAEDGASVAMLRKFPGPVKKFGKLSLKALKHT